MSRRQIVRIYTISEAEVPVSNTFVVKSRIDCNIESGVSNSVIKTGIFFPDHDQKNIDFDVYYIRSDYIPIKAFLMDHELVVLMMFDSNKPFKLFTEVPLASVKIKNYDRIAFMDAKKDNIKFKTNEVDVNEDSNTNNPPKPRI
jgi:hypothetical protein